MSPCAIENSRGRGGRALRARQAMDMWTMRLRRTGRYRGQRNALPTAAPFAHMPTASYH
jgi:hypothetical protein